METLKFIVRLIVYKSKINESLTLKPEKMKSKILLASILLFVSGLFSFSPPLVGEPVPGAEVYVELEPDDEPIANVQTNNEGEFVFSFPNGIKVPEVGTLSITITPPKNLLQSKEKRFAGMEKQTITIPFNKKNGPKFKFVLKWDSTLKTKSNKGGFAVSGRNTA